MELEMKTLEKLYFLTEIIIRFLKIRCHIKAVELIVLPMPFVYYIALRTHQCRSVVKIQLATSI